MPRCPSGLAFSSACSMPVDIGLLPRPWAAALKLEIQSPTTSVRSNVKDRFIFPPPCLGIAVFTNPAPDAELRGGRRPVNGYKSNVFRTVLFRELLPHRTFLNCSCRLLQFGTVSSRVAAPYQGGI